MLYSAEPAWGADAAESVGEAHLRLLRRVTIHLGDLMRASFEAVDLTPSQAFAVIAIGEKKGMSQASLVKTLGSDANTVSGIVRRLEQRGLVTRERKATDPRLVCLMLTPEGVAAAAAAADRVKALERAIGIASGERATAIVTRWLKDLLTVEMR